MCVREKVRIAVLAASPLSTMDLLFDSNKACMNEKSHHLTDVSATQGDKQGRAGGGRRGGRLAGGKEEGCVFSSATPFQDHGTVAGRQAGSQRANKPKNPSLFFPRLCASRRKK